MNKSRIIRAEEALTNNRKLVDIPLFIFSEGDQIALPRICFEALKKDYSKYKLSSRSSDPLSDELDSYLIDRDNEIIERIEGGNVYLKGDSRQMLIIEPI